MIVTEQKEFNGKLFTHNYSDEGFYIRKTGTSEIYAEAYDLLDANYTYEETDIKIKPDEEDVGADT